MSIEINVTNQIVQIDETSEIVEIVTSGGIGPAGAGVASGGTTGQVLAKKSNTNYDTEWINSSSSVLWGQVSGTLSNQTDLQNALNNKVPYTGATGAVSLGLFGLTAATLTLQPQALNSSTYKITQQMASNDYWSIYGFASVADYGDLYFELQDNAAFADGQRFRFHYGNASSGTEKDILVMDYNSATFDGTLVVNKDATINELTIGKGLASLSNNTALGYQSLFHVTTGNFNTASGYQALHNLTTGQYNTAIGQSSMFTATSAAQNVAIGVNALLLTTSGGSNVVVGLDGMQHNTTGSSNTAIGYNAGSHITGGTTPNTTASNSVYIGRDSKALADGQTNQIVIGQNAIGNGSNTATIGNTSITANYFTGSINGGSFVKSGGTSSQFLKADGSVDGTTYTPTSRTLTINGTTLDLSADRSWSVGGSMAIGGAITSATAGSVLFAGASGVLQQDNANLFWDDANNRLGIGTSTPSAKLQVNNLVTGDIIKANGTLNTSLTFFNDAGGRAALQVTGNTAATTFGGAYFNAIGYEEAWFSVVANQATTGNKNWRFGNLGSSNYFAIQKLNDAGNAITATPLTIFSSTGNVFIQGLATSTSDSGYRLDVNGSVKFGTSGSGTGMYWDNTNNRLGIGNATPVNIVDIVKNQNLDTSLRLTNTTSGINAEANINVISDSSAGFFLLGKKSTLNTGYKTVLSKDAYFYNSSTGGDISILNDFATGKIKFTAGGASTAQMTFTAAGRLLIGTTSELTYILDVNGTARVSGTTKIGNTTYTDSAANVITGIDGASSRFALANNSNYQDFIFIATAVSSPNVNSWGFGQRRDTYFGNQIGSFQFTGGYTNNSGIGSGSLRVPIICNPNGDVLINSASANSLNGNVFLSAGTGNVLIGTNSVGTFKLDVNGTARVSGKLSITAGTTAASQINLASSTAPTTPNDGDIWFDGTNLKMQIGGVTKTFTLI